MSVQPRDLPGGDEWTIAEAEALLQTLAGVISARIVARPGHEIEEIHVLTTHEVSPKQTVRNVESALLAHFDLELDHRKISVARSSAGSEGPQVDAGLPGRVQHHVSPGEGRILFLDHALATEDSRRLRVRVSLEWDGERYEGTATGTNLPRNKLDTLANATLRAVEAVHRAVAEDRGNGPLTLELDGVKLIDAFDQRFVLVAVHAISGREVTHLAGTGIMRESVDQAVILGALRATDRWVRGRI